MSAPNASNAAFFASSLVSSPTGANDADARGLTLASVIPAVNAAM